MIIGINEGHTLSGVGTGAVGIVKETDKNREIGKRLIIMLKENGHSVVDCTVDSSNNDLADACNIANKQHLDLFLSLHLNAYINSSANGVETYSLATTGKASEFSEKIQNELVTNISWSNRGCKTANFYVLKNTVAPAVLVELGFCTNKNDMDKWNTENICKALFKAITGNKYSNDVPLASSNVYRIFTDEVQQGTAYSNVDNILNIVKDSITNNATKIEIIKK